MNKLLDLKTGNFAPLPVVIVGYLFMAIGLMYTFTVGAGFIVLALFGGLLSFTHFGVLINTNDKTYKQYTSVYWVKFGKWKSIDEYPYLTILEVTEKRVTRSLSNSGFATRNMVFRVTLLNHNHYKKLLLKQLKDRDKAHELAEELARGLEIEKVIYSPG